MATHWRKSDHDGTAPVAAPDDDRFDSFDGTFRSGDFGHADPRSGDARDDRGGGDLVLAPLPSFPEPAQLPTRWDALDAGPSRGQELERFDDGFPGPGFSDPAFPDPAFPDPAFADRGFADPAFDDRGFSDPGFSDPAFSDPGFGPGTGLAVREFDDPGFAPIAAVVPGEYPAPLAIAAPVAPNPAPRASLIDDLQRVCRRLTGVGALANGIAREAINSSVTPQAPGGDPYQAMVLAVRACLEAQLPDEATIPYHQHRARLRRDLARRNDRDRAILAMRHLVGVPPSGVAARLDIPESQVRETGSAWCPDDSRVDSLAMLRGIDSWISTDLSSNAVKQTGNELNHLDETI